MLFRNAYKGVTGATMIFAVVFTLIAYPVYADWRWPNRYHPGRDKIVRDNGLPNGEGWRVEAWRNAKGHVVSWNSSGVPRDGDWTASPFVFWLVTHTVLFYGGLFSLQPYRKRLRVHKDDCDFWTMWARPDSAIGLVGPSYERTG